MGNLHENRHVSMYFLHSMPPFDHHYIIMVKGLLNITDAEYRLCLYEVVIPADNHSTSYIRRLRLSKHCWIHYVFFIWFSHMISLSLYD